MIIRDADIKILAMSQDLITPFNEDQLQPASYDVCLGTEFIVKPREGDRFEIESNEMIEFQPGDFILATTMERVKIPPFLACELRLKSTVARLGVGHALAVWIDPGFEGQITMELTIDGNHPIAMQAGDTIAQLIFQPVCRLFDKFSGAMKNQPQMTSVDTSYDGRYQGQQGPTEAIFNGVPAKGGSISGADNIQAKPRGSS